MLVQGNNINLSLAGVLPDKLWTISNNTCITSHLRRICLVIQYTYMLHTCTQILFGKLPGTLTKCNFRQRVYHVSNWLYHNLIACYCTIPLYRTMTFYKFTQHKMFPDTRHEWDCTNVGLMSKCIWDESERTAR